MRPQKFGKAAIGNPGTGLTGKRMSFDAFLPELKEIKHLVVPKPGSIIAIGHRPAENIMYVQYLDDPVIICFHNVTTQQFNKLMTYKYLGSRINTRFREIHPTSKL